jgi:hypothetical protein
MESEARRVCLVANAMFSAEREEGRLERFDADATLGDLSRRWERLDWPGGAPL